MTLGSTQPLTEMSTRNLPGGKGRPALKADNLTAACEPPRPVTRITLPLSDSDVYQCILIRKLLNYNTRVEAGSNTSTVTLRVVRGDEMGLKKAAP
jgi:hypothetical protein